MVNILKYRKELDHLRSEHNTVETKISDAVKRKVINQFEVQNLKKKKLMIKESISQLESILVGDIVA